MDSRRFTRRFLTPLLAAGLLGLAACGGEEPPTSSEAPPTSSAPIASKGVITSFGNVWINGVNYRTARVNGVSYHIDSASISTDDNPGSESDLAVGMIVTISSSGTLIDGIRTASSMHYDNDLTGPITTGSIDPDAQTFTVLGQMINATGAIFDDGIATFADLQEGMVVEVSGFPNAMDGIDATRIEFEAASLSAFLATGGEIELKGTIDTVDVDASTLLIGDLTVNWSNADISDMPADTSDWQGLFVEVECESAPCLDGTTLLATEIAPEQEGIDASSGVEIEIEGPITDFNSITDFRVNGQRVDASSASFMHGTADNLENGVRIEVEGQIVNEILLAEEVEFEHEDNVRIEAILENVDVVADTITLMGIVIQVNSTTLMEDNSVSPERILTLNDLGIGDAIEIHGFLDASGNVVATQLERESSIDLDGFTLQGPPAAVSDISDPTYRVLDIIVDTTDLADADFENENDIVIGRSAFFMRLANNDPPFERVKAEGSFNGGTLFATPTSDGEVQFED